VRIPLDYYRILGLPIQATPEQLQQSYRDRALQLPRREYSELAIAARKQLLDEAYGVLRDPEQRSNYDTSFLAKTYELEAEAPENRPQLVANQAEGEIDPHSPCIEIKPTQLVGALLILHELGEYELLLKLGRPYLSGGSHSASLEQGRLGDAQLVRADIALTVCLACLELGREQWQQGQYEGAANSLETGQGMLLQEGLFASVRGEIQTDLYKLRPYRVLELLALPETNPMERRQGLRLLQDMLQERGGIDGTGDDRSGLSIDDFLRFIQQLRGYLTSTEQQSLFEAESHRPSAVATYLAVYALLGSGFARRQPDLINRAQQMLVKLGKRQDVHLEQAVCTLLLGQTEVASRALDLSQEYESLAFIREHSQGSPDLLPGLCLYGERWLQTEVFPHFRDLAKEKAFLKDYFADEQVQAYLENLPESSAETASDWSVLEQQRLFIPTVVPRTAASSDSAHPGLREMPARAQSWRTMAENGYQNGNSRSRGGTATLVPPIERSPSPSSTNVPTAERVSNVPTRDKLGVPRTIPPTPKSPEQLPRLPGSRSPNPATKLKMDRLVLLAIAGVAGISILIFLLMWLQKQIQGIFTPTVQPIIRLDRSPIPIPSPEKPAATTKGSLNQATAKQAIETWLAVKSKALGQENAVDQLSQILVEPALSRWRSRADAARATNSYWKYQHSIEVKSFYSNTTDPNRAIAEAQVSESANLYEGGQLNRGSSYNENLRVRYELVRQDSKWLIRDMTILK
jgi:hypothetical protein